MTHAQSLPEDAIYELLSDTRRHQLLSLLQQHGSMDVEEIAAGIAARERHTDDGDTRQIAVSLVHNHLPLLEDYDVVQHDRDRGTVALLDVFDELEQYLDAQPTRESVLQNLRLGN